MKIISAKVYIRIDFLFDKEFKDARNYIRIKDVYERLSRYPDIELVDINLKYSIKFTDEKGFLVEKSKLVNMSKESKFFKAIKSGIIKEQKKRRFF